MCHTADVLRGGRGLKFEGASQRVKRNGFRAKEKKNQYYKIGKSEFVESSNWELTPGCGT